MFARKLARMVKNDQIMQLDDEIHVFVCDNGHEPIAIITRDTESGEVIWYGVYVAKIINSNVKAWEPINIALDQVEEDEK